MVFRIIALAVGYCCGLLQTGIIIGKMQNIDIREYGSKNAGTTNAFRVMGAKKGSLVFVGDFLKAWIPCMAFRLIFKDSTEINNILLVLFVGLGVVLGHSFPAHLGFRGGKGVASIAGLIGTLDWRIAVVCAIVFIVTLFATKYVSLSSILVMAALVTMTFYVVGIGGFGPLNNTEIRVVVTIIALLSVFRHADNIKRLMNKTENKIGKKK